MGLSDREQKVLEEMERMLYAEDPRFATSMRSAGLSGTRSVRTGLLAVLMVVGLAGIAGGVATKLTWLGILGSWQPWLVCTELSVPRFGHCRPRPLRLRFPQPARQTGAVRAGPSAPRSGCAIVATVCSPSFELFSTRPLRTPRGFFVSGHIAISRHQQSLAQRRSGKGSERGEKVRFLEKSGGKGL